MEANSLGMILGFTLLSILLAAWLFSLMFSNGKKIKLLEAQVELLNRIADKLDSTVTTAE